MLEVTDLTKYFETPSGKLHACEGVSLNINKGETLGQGKETVAKLLSENKALQDEIVKQIMTEVGKGIGFVPEAGEMNHSDEEEENDNEPVIDDANEKLSDDNDEGILEISDSDSDSE